MPGLQTIALGLGANLGDRIATLATAVEHLTSKRSPRFIVQSISPVFESEALVPEGSPADWNIPFLNIVVTGFSALSPEELLQFLKSVEVFLGRKPAPRWAPRELDIDILAIEGVTLESEQLQLPHPGIAKRSFVIAPFWKADAQLAVRLQLPREADDKQQAQLAGSLLQKRFASLLASKTDAYPEVIRAAASETQTKLVGILNCTPDSFSDGGIVTSPSVAIERVEFLLNAGAEIIDIGAESTRPGASVITPEQEQARLFPILQALHSFRLRTAQLFDISVDTRNHGTARKALAMGADWLNDVSGFVTPEMIDVAAGGSFPVILMHNLGVPPSKDSVLDDAVPAIDQLLAWFNRKLEQLTAAGIRRERIIIDPGIGFGKSALQSFEIIRGITGLWQLGQPLLVGHSRKSFLAHSTPRAASERDLETSVLSATLSQSGIEYIRVHDVESSARACEISNFLHELPAESA